MAKTEDKLTKNEVITVYMFLAMMAAIMIACGWVIYSSWNWVIP